MITAGNNVRMLSVIVKLSNYLFLITNASAPVLSRHCYAVSVIMKVTKFHMHVTLLLPVTVAAEH